MARTMRGHCVVVSFLLVLWAAGAVFADGPLDRPANHATDHTFGVEVALFTRTSTFEDPYAVPFGGGVFYSYRGLRFLPQLALGAAVSAFGFLSINEFFGNSWLLRPCISAEYRISLPNPADPLLLLAPYAQLGVYFRRYLFMGEATWSRRATLSVGTHLYLNAEKNFLYGLGLGYLLYLDQQPIHALLFSIRLGMRLPARVRS